MTGYDVIDINGQVWPFPQSTGFGYIPVTGTEGYYQLYHNATPSLLAIFPSTGIVGIYRNLD
jgi:hypothetical protein